MDAVHRLNVGGIFIFLKKKKYLKI
jgi:hypothetical protein